MLRALDLGALRARAERDLTESTPIQRRLLLDDFESRVRRIPPVLEEFVVRGP